jgi:hypothetical protein
MKSLNILLIVTLLLISCKDKAGFTSTKSYFNNLSNKNLSLIFVNQPSAIAAIETKVDRGEKKLVANETFDGGKDMNASQPLLLLGFKDSVVVKFEDGKKNVYYNRDTNGSNTSAIKYDDARNFLNPQKWIKTIISENNNTISIEFNFSFNQEDYLRAK